MGTRRIPVYEALAGDIAAAGAERVFGLLSDDTALFASTLDAMGVRFFGTRHENNGIAMAEGYAAATGRAGIAVIGRGPATANGLHGAMYAQRAGSRTLLVFATGPTSGAYDTKDFNAAGVLQAAGFRVFAATSAGNARGILADALAAVRRPGCAVLLLPSDVQMAHIDVPEDTLPAAEPPPLAPLPRPRAAALRNAAGLLDKSRRPLIVAGLGAWHSGARQAIEQLAQATGALLATTLKAKDMFRGHPHDAGLVGSFSHAMGRRFMAQADCVLAFGAGLNYRTTSHGTALPADAPLIHVDIDATHIGRWCPADVALVGDAREVAQALLPLLAPRRDEDKPFHGADVRGQLAGFDPVREIQPMESPRTMDPRLMAVELDRLLPRQRNTVYDAGNFLQVQPYVAVPDPGCLKNSLDFSSLGMGFGTALGFAAGRPGEVTVLFIGDGGLLMTLGELETAVREDLPLVVVLMNDCAYGAELHYLKGKEMSPRLAVFPDVDFAPIAAGFGFDAHTVRTLAELRALAPLLADPQGPVFLDCKINANVVAGFMAERVALERRA